MHDVGRVWRKEMVWWFKISRPAMPIRRCLAFILRSFEQILITIHRRVIAFLTGSASHSEFSVNRSKQTSAQFLTGSRIVIKRSVRCSAFRRFFSHRLQSASAIFPPDTLTQLGIIFS